MQLPRVYIFTNIVEVTAKELAPCASHSLLIPIHGEAATSKGEKIHAHAYVLPPHPAMTVSNAPGKSWSAFRIYYDTVSLQHDSLTHDPLAPTFELAVYTPKAVLRIGRIVKELFRYKMEISEGYRLHMLFQELVYLLLAGIEASSGQGENDEMLAAVRDSITYIEDSLGTKISHAKLAERSGLSLRHYSRLFHKLTGTSPMKYVTGRRLEAAQRLLLTGDYSIQHVASQTGFSEPFHFSRTFKQHTGVSPRLYVQLRRTQSRMVAYQYLGELLTLGIRPVGAPGLLLGGKFIRASSRARGIGNIGQTVTMPNLSVLKQIEPDAIITFDGHHYDEYMRIAPTLDIPWLLPAAKRFQLLATRLGKETEANDWLEHFQSQVDRVKALLYPQMAGERVSFWWMRGLPERFDVYFIQELFYHYLQMMPPLAVQRIWEMGNYPFKQNVSISDMSHYAGDRLFVVVGPGEEDQCQFQLLCESEQWRSIAAVQAGRVHVLTTDWIYGDPISLEGQLGEIITVMKQAYK